MKANIREFFYGFERPHSTSIDLSAESPKVLMKFGMGLVGFHLRVDEQSEPRFKVFHHQRVLFLRDEDLDTEEFIRKYLGQRKRRRNSVREVPFRISPNEAVPPMFIGDLMIGCNVSPALSVRLDVQSPKSVAIQPLPEGAAIGRLIRAEFAQDHGFSINA